MTWHYLKIFCRDFLKGRVYSLVNVVGLSIGLACAILVYAWALTETGYDQFNRNYAHIFQVMVKSHMPDGTTTWDDTPGQLSTALLSLPEVKVACRVNFFPSNMLFRAAQKTFYERGVYADSSLFRLFTVELKVGNQRRPLPDKNSIAISSRLAKKYFGNEDALGKIMKIDNQLDVRVTAIFGNLPANSSLQFDFILPYENYAATDPYNDEWGAWTGGDTYVLLHNGASIDEFKKKIASTITQPKIWPRWDSTIELFLLPMKDWRLRNHFENGVQTGGRYAYVLGFAWAGLFILVMACFNFINMSTARSATRSLEVGIRKVFGAKRFNVMRQFYLEAFLLTMMSMVVALAMVFLLAPQVSLLTSEAINVDFSSDLLWLGIAIIVVVTGLAAGFYPALILSSFKIIHVLKGRVFGFSGIRLRKALIVFQFALSFLLVVGALVLHEQIEYMRNKDLGFDKNNVLYLPANGKLLTHYPAFREELLQQSEIQAVGFSSDNPMNVFGGMVPGDDAWPGQTKGDEFVLKYLTCDAAFLPALNFQFVEGRNFSEDIASDTMNFVVNEAAVSRMHLKDPVGQELKFDRQGKIVGVVKDFNATSLENPVEPVLIAMRPGKSGNIFIRYQPGKAGGALKVITKLAREMEPNFPADVAFLDQTFNTQYKKEITIDRIAKLLTGVAIFIAGLGLFGVSMYTTERRTKEIGIRKVLGASVMHLINLLFRDFGALVLIALLLSGPVAWWLAGRILSHFAFHLVLGINLFFLLALAMFLFAFIIVSFHSSHVALRNPAETLKTD